MSVALSTRRTGKPEVAYLKVSVNHLKPVLNPRNPHRLITFADPTRTLLGILTSVVQTLSVMELTLIVSSRSSKVREYSLSVLSCIYTFSNWTMGPGMFSLSLRLTRRWKRCYLFWYLQGWNIWQWMIKDNGARAFSCRFLSSMWFTKVKMRRSELNNLTDEARSSVLLIEAQTLLYSNADQC
jgi:hypothetical protein